MAILPRLQTCICLPRPPARTTKGHGRGGMKLSPNVAIDHALTARRCFACDTAERSSKRSGKSWKGSPVASRALRPTRRAFHHRETELCYPPDEAHHVEYRALPRSEVWHVDHLLDVQLVHDAATEVCPGLGGEDSDGCARSFDHELEGLRSTLESDHLAKRRGKGCTRLRSRRTRTCKRCTPGLRGLPRRHSDAHC